MFLNGESTEYCGKAVVAIAADPKKKYWNGSTLITTDMGNYYSYTDIDGNLKNDLKSLLESQICVGRFVTKPISLVNFF